MNKITCICLGVRSMERAIKFYRDGLGFKTDEKENNPKVVFFDTAGTKFELYPLDLLVEDINEENPPKINSGFAGVTLNIEGDCLLAVGDEDLIKVHFHTNTPWKLLEYCDSLGDIYDVVIENMERQENGLQG